MRERDPQIILLVAFGLPVEAPNIVEWKHAVSVFSVQTRDLQKLRDNK